MNYLIQKFILPFYIALLITIAAVAQTTEKSPGIVLFDKGDFVGAIELLKKSDDLVELNYLGYAYERSGNEKEARNAFDRSFKNGYKEFGDEIIKRASFDPKKTPPDDKLSTFLEKYAQRIVVTAVSARRTLQLKGPSAKDNVWMMKARMLGEIGSIIASDRLIYSARELDVDAKITNKPRPGYTDEARTNGTQGTVEFLVLLDLDSTMKGAIPTKLLANGLTEKSYTAVNKLSFIPAQRAGKPVAMLKTLSYSFSIY